MTIKDFGRQLADQFTSAASKPIDLRRECHCNRSPGIGPHWHSLAEGCAREPVVPATVEQPDPDEQPDLDDRPSVEAAVESGAVTTVPPLCWCTGTEQGHAHDPSYEAREFPCPPQPVPRGAVKPPTVEERAAVACPNPTEHAPEHQSFGEREGALYVALRMTAGDDRHWSPDEVMAFADYLLGLRGEQIAPQDAEPAEPVVCGHEIQSVKPGANGQPRTLRCVLPAGHSTPTPHRDGNGTSWTRTDPQAKEPK